MFWSERHQAERCRKCGKWVGRVPNDPNDPTDVAPIAVAPLAPIAAQEARNLAPVPPIARPAPDERSAVLDFSAARNEIAVDPPAPKKRLRQPSRDLPAGAAARRKVLISHFARLANGEELDKLEVLDLVMGLLEDAHVHEPLIFGPDAASHFAELHQASADEWLCWPRADTGRQRSA